jgi:putative flippase GtrA
MDSTHEAGRAPRSGGKQSAQTTGAVAAPRGTRLVAAYAVFALISIVANLGSQKLALLVYGGWMAVPLSVFVGTGVGLVVKFVLDKLWIFQYEHRNVAHGVTSFLLYSFMGLATTAIFWGFEFGADRVFGTETARLAGGFVGLVIGYMVKYRLDKQFVFR